MQNCIYRKKKKKIPCPNIGCKKTFPYRLAKLRFLKKCNGIPPEPTVEKVNDHWVCNLCKVHIRHQNNLQRRTVCNLNKTNKYYKCSSCDKVFQHCSKLNRHLKPHIVEKEGTCENCGKVFHFSKKLHQHKISRKESESLYPSMVFESSLNVIPDIDTVSSNTSMLNDAEVATDLNTIPCSS